MTAVGAPTWSMINGLPALRQNAYGDGCTSGAVLNVVNMAGSWTIETVHRQDTGDSWFSRWTGPASAGGFHLFNFSAGTRIGLYEFDAAGAVQRQIFSPAGSIVPAARTVHYLVSSVTAGTSGRTWINGVPVVATLAGAGVPVNPVASAVGFGMAGGVGFATAVLMRIYPFALTNEDASCLYQQAKILTGGDV
jgi:hypothetical protein